MENELKMRAYEIMFKIRSFEENSVKLFESGELPGWLHSYIGEEAVAAGVCLNLNDDDYITSTHRGHGHCIAKGLDISKMMAELFGRTTGCCKGRGGSMHICDPSIGVLSANGIVGGGIPIATGAAFGCKYLKNNKVVVAFFGDGAADQGSFHESLNLASIWDLPIIYVCENNLYAETNPCTKHLNIKNIADRAKSYNIDSIIVDGMDVIDVYTKIKNIIDSVRTSNGPVLVEAKTYRYRGHYEGDPEVYRTKDEISSWKKKDSIEKLKKSLLENKILSEKDIADIQKKVITEVENAIDFSRKSPEPLKEDVMDYVFV